MNKQEYYQLLADTGAYVTEDIQYDYTNSEIKIDNVDKWKYHDIVRVVSGYSIDDDDEVIRFDFLDNKNSSSHRVNFKRLIVETEEELLTFAENVIEEYVRKKEVNINDLVTQDIPLLLSRFNHVK